MRELIQKKHRSMLWKDELGDEFLLLKAGEVFINNKTTCRCYFFSNKNLPLLRKEGVIFNEDKTDDTIYIFDILNRNLSRLIELEGFKKRPNLKGNWIKNAERKLAHKIIPYNPVSLSNRYEQNNT